MKNKVKEMTELFKELSFLHFKHSFVKLREIGLHPGHFMILELLYENNGMDQKELVKKTHREKATITKTIQRLEKSGFITKRKNDNDKRASFIMLSEKGIESYKKFLTIQNEESKKIKTILTEEDLDITTKILHKLIQGYKKGDGK